MSPTLALIPAKRVSEGVPGKNWRHITPGKSCVQLATEVGRATCNRVCVTTDWELPYRGDEPPPPPPGLQYLTRPPDLPDTMLAVVQHALEQVPGPDDEIIVLLQPTSPLRSVETVKQAIQMLMENELAESVVSVSPSYPVQWAARIDSRGYLCRAAHSIYGPGGPWPEVMPTRRQDCEATYRRDGTVYAFRRSTLREFGDIYGVKTLPLHTPPAESLSIDTPDDWEEAVRRLQVPTPSRP